MQRVPNRSFGAGPLLAVLVLIALTFAAGQSAMGEDAEDDHMGLTEYEIACMPCHGIDGHGDGPMAKSLARPPADLTKIAKANGGVFPVKTVTEMIDGRSAVIAHGAREMPVWGSRYRTQRRPARQAHGRRQAGPRNDRGAGRVSAIDSGKMRRRT